jgi:PAS domain S-box-containing protein
MGARERVILNSKADRLAERVSEMGWAHRPGLGAPIPRPALGGVPARNSAQPVVPRPAAGVLPEYTALVDRNRKYVEVSDSFCKLLGYDRNELIGKKYDDLTAPRTNNIQTIFDLFMKSGYMHGIWILMHRRGTRILVRYEAWIRPDGLTESQMELLGAGA